jgi:hypothetical protein
MRLCVIENFMLSLHCKNFYTHNKIINYKTTNLTNTHEKKSC